MSLSDAIAFQKKELRGSRLRCLMLTSMPREQVAATLTALVAPIATVDQDLDRWVPGGFLDPEEAKLGECTRFLTADICRELTNWWLQRRHHANTPNWDVVSTCTIEGRPGLMVIEAKAHDAEAKKAGKTLGHPENDEQIALAIGQANAELNLIEPGLALSRDKHYQLCNRFAWAWKLASLGVPTILVYFGFLRATEMTDIGRPFATAAEWNTHIREHANGTVPQSAWGRRLQTSGAPMWALVRSIDCHWISEGHARGAGA